MKLIFLELEAVVEQVFQLAKSGNLPEMLKVMKNILSVMQTRETPVHSWIDRY